MWSSWRRRWSLVGGAAAGYVAWKQYEASQLPAGIVSVNGRVEATQVDISTKIAGRVIEIVPHEGDIVSPGEVVARIDTSETVRAAAPGAGLGRARPPNGRNPSGGASPATRPSCSSRTSRCDARRRWSHKGWSTHEHLRPAHTAAEERGCGPQGGQVAGRRSPRVRQDRRRQGRRAAGGDRRFDDQVAGPRPGAVSPRRAGGGASARRQDRDGDRSLGRLHDRIPPRLRRRGGLRSATTRAWWWTPPRNTFFPPRSRSWRPNRNSPPRRSRSSPNASSSCFRVKLQAPLQLLKGMEDQVKAGLRGSGLCEDRSCRRVARQAGGQAAAQPSRPANRLPGR